MLFVLLGIRPVNSSLADRIKRNLTSLLPKHQQERVGEHEGEDDDDVNKGDNRHIIRCSWNPSYGIAPDVDHEDQPLTMLLSVQCYRCGSRDDDDEGEGDMSFVSESIVTAVQSFVDNDHDDDDVLSPSPAVEVEVWATSPVPLPIKPLDGYEPYIEMDILMKQQKQKQQQTLHRIQEALQEWGIVFQRGVLLQNDDTKTSHNEWKDLIDRRINKIEDALATHQSHICVGQDPFQFTEIASRNKQRFDLRLNGHDVHDLVEKTILNRPIGFDVAEATTTTTTTNSGILVEGLGDIHHQTFLAPALHPRPLYPTTTIRDFVQSVLSKRREDNATTRPENDGDRFLSICSSNSVEDKENYDHDNGDNENVNDFDFDVSVVYSRPGATAQGWHADGKHLPGELDAGHDCLEKIATATNGNSDNDGSDRPEGDDDDVEKSHNGGGGDGWKTRLAKPYAICLFIPLIDLNDDVGYTQFWPGSHRHRDIAGFGPVAEVTQSVWNGDKCKAGDGIWYDYRLYHQGMPNYGQTVRPIIQIIFKRKWYIERDNYGRSSVYGHATSSGRKELA
jgi:hypothetical protein